MLLDNPATVAAPFGDRFSHVARIDLGTGALLVLSGQVGVDDAGVIAEPDDVAAQTERIFALIGGILQAHGASFADVLHVRTFMTDLNDLAGYGAVRRRYLSRSETGQHDRRGQPAVPARCGARGRGHRVRGRLTGLTRR